MKHLKSHVRHDDPEIMLISHIHVPLLSSAISFIVSPALPSSSPFVVLKLRSVKKSSPDELIAACVLPHFVPSHRSCESLKPNHRFIREEEIPRAQARSMMSMPINLFNIVLSPSNHGNLNRCSDLNS